MLLTTDQAAQHLGISARRIRKLIQDGRLPAARYGRSLLIDSDDLRLVRDRRTGSPGHLKPRRLKCECGHCRTCYSREYGRRQRSGRAQGKTADHPKKT